MPSGGGRKLLLIVDCHNSSASMMLLSQGDCHVVQNFYVKACHATAVLFHLMTTKNDRPARKDRSHLRSVST
jgi:hypothetical protein